MKEKENRKLPRLVEGLSYDYPFVRGDVCYFVTKDGTVLTRNKLIVIHIGVPVELKSGILESKDVDGHISRVSLGTGKYVEGVTVKYDDGFDYTLGYTEIKKVENLIRVSDYENQIGIQERAN